MDLDSVTLGQAVSVAVAVCTVAAFWWRSASVVAALRREIDGKVERAEVVAALDRKASNDEVIKHATAIADLRVTGEVSRTEMLALRETLTGLREDFRALSARIERWMERG